MTRLKEGPSPMVKPRIQPLVVGVKSHPPTIALEYNEWIGEEMKLKSRYMPLRDFTNSSDVGKAAVALQNRHFQYLEKVPLIYLEKEMRIIQEIRKGNPVSKLPRNKLQSLSL